MKYKSKINKEKINDTSFKINCVKMFLIFGLGVFAFQIMNCLHVFGKGHNSIVGNSFITVISFLVFISLISLYFKLPRDSFRERNGYFFMLIGVFFLFLGDLLWLVNEVYLNNLVPVGGLPDLSWNLAYIFLIVAFGFFLSLSKKSTKFFFYIILIIIAFLGLFIIYQDVSEDLELGTFTLSHALQDTYILYDFILILMMFYLIYPLFVSKKKEAYPFLIICFGFISRLIYDLIFVNMSENGTYYTSHPVDLLYVGLYLFILLAILIKVKLIENK